MRVCLDGHKKTVQYLVEVRAVDWERSEEVCDRFTLVQKFGGQACSEQTTNRLLQVWGAPKKRKRSPTMTLQRSSSAGVGFS